MSERFPTNEEPVEPENQVEQKVVSYEQALDAAKALRAAGVENPFMETHDDPQIQSLLDIIAQWEGGENPQTAVRDYRLFAEAGYSSSQFFKDVLESLQDELNWAERDGNSEALAVIVPAIEDAQVKLEAVDPKEAKKEKIAAKFKEAEQLIEEKKYTSAVGTVYNTLAHKPLVLFISDELRQSFLKLRTEALNLDLSLPRTDFDGFPPDYKGKKIGLKGGGKK